MTTATTERAAVALPFWQLLAVGAVTLAFGIAVLVQPHATLRLLGVLAGIWLVGMGLMRLVGAFSRAHGLTQQILDGALGLILLVVGATCLRDTVSGAIALSVVIGLAWLLSGFAELLLGLLSRGRARLGLFVLAVASIVVGLVFLSYPGLSLPALILLTGITSLIIGTAEIVVALQSRRAAHPAQNT
ncbi:HdeD family acid-resistance protein [Dactylosporangium sp. NPDC048998]|uniref:HdeD family acid-resistance protein n=1 Tax=Dactylosporangium sp. NPDC048998 TaxID=3363976 RepID=UPI00371ED88C